jgi:hypothetical protein
MPTNETIKASDAPKVPKKLSKLAQELVSAINGLNKDQVLRLTPDDGKSMRGLKTSVGRIAANAGIKVESWSIDDEYLHVKRREK